MFSIDEKLLRFFYESDGRPVSGEEIARQLKLSRTAVWHHVESLRRAGYEIEAQPHLGYRLIASPDRLIRDEIRARLKTSAMGCDVVSFEEVDSTNDVAIRLAEEGAREGTLVVAESQRKGRGRLGRAWHSPKGAGIWCSLILRPKLRPAEASQLTLLAALAMLRAVKKTAGLATLIKWPNDLLLHSKKVCGILSEMSSEPDLIHFVVVGVGINVNWGKSEMPSKIRETATSLSEHLHKKISRVELLCQYLWEMEALYLSFCEEGFAPILDEIKKHCDSLGRQVEIKTGERSLAGQAVDLDLDGALLLRHDGGRLEKIYSGDLSCY